MKHFLSIGLGLLSLTAISSATLAQEDGGTLGPWRVGDFAVSSTPADDRPNDESRQIIASQYKSLVPDKVFKGDKGLFSFRVSPRSDRWAGILLLDESNKPLPRSKSLVMSANGVPAKMDGAGLAVFLSDPSKPATEGYSWRMYDTQIMYSDASPIIYPKTRIAVLDKKGTQVVDEVTVDFSQWKLQDSNVQLNGLLEGPTSGHGFVTASDGAFHRDGKTMFFWGGHENHVPSKAQTDAYAESYAAAGINVQRNIGIPEILADAETGAVDAAQLDKFHYLVAKLGENGIYFFLSDAPGYGRDILGYKKGEAPAHYAAGDHFTITPGFWIDQKFRTGWKQFLRNVLTAPNPYAAGKALKDDPSLIGFELANETGLTPRRFDFNRVDLPETSSQWRELFNAFLLKKYGNRERLAEAWKQNAILPHEDPSKSTIVFPTSYRGARGPFGGTGQHDMYVTGRWYNNGWYIPAEVNPRLRDAIEFNNSVAKKPRGFDFNNLATPEESTALRIQFNEFLMKKYGSREKLAEAWLNDPLFPWESPDEAVSKAKNSRNAVLVADPTKPKQTILIPSNYRGETEYKQVTDKRVADPRVSDAMEFVYEIQKDWATDLSRFLKEDIGLKCGVGWNGDTFHVGQLANHMANMNSPLDLAIAAAYMDSDNGDQLTSRVKNLKRFTTYGRIYGRPMFSYEWSIWGNQGPFVYEYALLAALMGRNYGFDGYAHHKMAAVMYPVSDPIFSLSPKRGHYITPLTDRPRRGAFYVGQWIMARSKIQEEPNRVLIGFPHDNAFVGGPERKMSNWAFENWIMYQMGTEDYVFKDVYDGPADRVVVHSGHGPYGDYRKAKHAILWCHSDTGRDGKDAEAKKKWFAMHGITFAPGQKYFLNDQFFATTEDLSEYNVVHKKAESTRDKMLADNAARAKAETNDVFQMATVADDYWAAEPDAQPTEIDRQIYAAMKKWNCPLPFEEGEIDKVWRSQDRSMSMDTTKLNFTAHRNDMQMWFGKAGPNTKVSLDQLSASTNERQFAIALLPWDTGDMKTAKTLAVWCMWNSEISVKPPTGSGTPKVYAVNWLGKRIFEVNPTKVSDDQVTFRSARHDDIFCYEIGR